MKSKLSKTFAACSIALASLFAGSAQAGIYNPFTVQKPGTTGETNQFEADRMVAAYTEIITFDQAASTFKVSIFFDVSNFYFKGPELEGTGLGNNWDLYGVYTASGVVTSVGNETQFIFDPNQASSLNFYLDKLNNTSLASEPGTGGGAFTFNGAGEDVRLAFGKAVSGDGSIEVGCDEDEFCGGFKSVTTVNLDPAGEAFFVKPNPFYNFSLQTGQLNTFDVEGTQRILGSLDIMFNTPGEEVPEPASLGLLGLGLLGLGAARRRKQAK